MDQELFEMVLNKSKHLLQEKLIAVVSEKTLMEALPLVIECVEAAKDKGITGEEKRNLVLKVVLFIVKQSGLDEHKKAKLCGLIEDGTVETTINMVVDASKGKLQLNRKTKRKILKWIFNKLTVCLDAVPEPTTPDVMLEVPASPTLSDVLASDNRVGKIENVTIV